MRDPDLRSLRHHGDSDLVPGCVDLAVNVRAGTPPAWLREQLRQAVDDLELRVAQLEHRLKLLERDSGN